MYSVPELASRLFYICCPWTDLDVTPKTKNKQKTKQKKHKNNIARTITNVKGFPYLNTSTPCRSESIWCCCAHKLAQYRRIVHTRQRSAYIIKFSKFNWLYFFKTWQWWKYI